MTLDLSPCPESKLELGNRCDPEVKEGTFAHKEEPVAKEQYQMDISLL